MENFVNSLGSIDSDFIEFDMIIGFTGGRAEYLIRPTGYGCFAESAESLVSNLGSIDDVFWHNDFF
jgi:hypothetical protein